MDNIIRIAIDGPSGAGKSTIAKELAKRMQIDYIDTGAMYRAAGYKMLITDTDIDDLDEVEKVLQNTDIDFSDGHVILDGEVVDGFIRTPEISRQASLVSKIPAVRIKLVELQRNMGRTKSVIMDGRDIGTNVFPDAEFKFYLIASAEVRAERRCLELQEKGQDVSFDQILKDIEERDYNDMTRELNPLRKAEDAIEVDSSNMNIAEVVGFIYNRILGL